MNRLIFDYDGTLTDTASHAQPYHERFGQVIQERLGLTEQEMTLLEEKAREDIRTKPELGWKVNEVVIAPATADPYVFTASIYQQIIDSLGTERNPADLIFAAHHAAYANLSPTFREGAGDLLEDALNSGEVTIVTNSGTEDVRRQLANYGFSQVPVIGNAQKFMTQKDWEGVQETIQPQGFPRPVHLRKQNYARILKELGADSGDTTVVGDIYELDLALPDFLGMHIVQVANGYTPEHEVAYLRQHPKGHHAHNLMEVREILRGR